MALKKKIEQYTQQQGQSVPLRQVFPHAAKAANTQLVFPQIYRQQEYFYLAYRIYDDFVEKLNIKAELTEAMVRDVLIRHIAEYALPKAALKSEIADFIINLLLYYGPISGIIKIGGSHLNDIIVNTKDYIDIIYDGQTVSTPFRFRNEAELRRIINRMLAASNRKIDEAHPIASGKLPDGSRIEIQIPPVAANIDKDGHPGSYVTVRKFREIPLLFESMLDHDLFDLKMAYFLLKAVRGKLNIVVSGGTSSGKTTLLNALSRFIDSGDQLLTIEDTKEMKPQMPCHAIRAFEARPENEEGTGAITIEQLLRTALRSSPRRIIVGECRGPEIVTMLNAMNTGHPGSMTTIHADDTKEAIVRIENMFLEARPTANMMFVRSQIVSAVDLVVQLFRFPDGRRRVVKISEPERRIEENGVVSMLDLFAFRNSDNGGLISSSGTFGALSTSQRAVTKMMQNGVTLDKRIFDDDYVVSKDMVMDELSHVHPSRMCGWQEHYMAEILQNSFVDGKHILERWPNLKQ
jgi:pilus assembly protein CpaF